MKLKQFVGIIILMALIAGAVVFGVRAKHNSQISSSGAKVKVIASFYPLYDFARNVGGDKVQVTNITPAGSEPHDYEPTPQQLIDAQKADVFIYNGGTLEVWVDKFLPDFKHVSIKASDKIDLKQGQDEDGNESAAIKDPHFWLDPILAEQIVDNIKDGLIKADPGDSDYFTAQASSYKAKLAKLDQDFKKGLMDCPSRVFITSHAAFGYLAKRYNLEVYSIAGVTPDQEPSAAKLAELSQLVRSKNIKYVFFESLVSPRLADTIAQETGAKTAVFDPIEGISDEDQKQGKDYISVQEQNLSNLRTALACQ
jgi:zinc transport system substrate-binding protein